jgi:RNA polymerase sigma-70 factor (ECF subfamily)
MQKKANSPEELLLLQTLLRPGDEVTRQRCWQSFVRTYERTIIGCILKVFRRYGVTSSSQDLDDLVADVWLALLRDDMHKLRQYQPDRGYRIASFIGLVATHLTIDHLRARRAHAALDEAAEVASDCEEASASLEAHQQAKLARAAIGRLNSDEREFVFEVFHAERSPGDLARTLGLTTNTIYSRKFKIREKLARIVAGMEQDRELAIA